LNNWDFGPFETTERTHLHVLFSLRSLTNSVDLLSIHHHRGPNNVSKKVLTQSDLTPTLTMPCTQHQERHWDWDLMSSRAFVNASFPGEPLSDNNLN
jgi:hypothetical protein